MNNHKHNLDSWPFVDLENTAAFTCSHILDGAPILRVTHDEDDGAWQFLCGQMHKTEDGRVVCLGCMVERDKSLLTLADLPLGWCADRDSTNSNWVREINPPLDEGNEDIG